MDAYALLVGIDCYLPNLLPDGKSYRNLSGCVRDVRRVATLLTTRLELPPDHIITLTSTNTGSAPTDDTATLPTYENMVAALQRLTAQAAPGDIVHVHYSGHGGRARTIYPALKGAAGIDECLVPYNIGEPGARYLRDVELAALLQEMVRKGLVVSVVLDSCHSGGMVRGEADVDVRGLDTVDTTARPVRSLVASRTKLAVAWRAATVRGTRDVTAGSGWLPEPEGYTLLAACRPTESALEYAFNGREREGVLTHWLLDSLQDIGPGLSYKTLHDRLLARIHSQFEAQTPQLQGEGDRVVFGVERVPPAYAVLVLRSEPARQRVLLNAGQAHNLRRGSSFVIYPHGAADLNDSSQRLAVAELAEDPGASESWARVAKTLSPRPIEPGAQAVLTSSARLIRRVALVPSASTLAQDVAFQGIAALLPASGWLELAADGQAVAYQIMVTPTGALEICDAQGAPIANLRPPVQASDPAAPAIVVGRLAQLARYHALVEFANHDQLSPLARKLVVELLGKRAHYDPMDAYVAEEQFARSGGAKRLRVGEWTALRIKNTATRSLNVTVLNLRPTWEVKQVFPANEGDNFVQFEPGQEIVIPLQASLKDGYTAGRDVLKVFATVGSTSFRWLELPPLDQPVARSQSLRGRSPANPLEELLSAFSADRPPTRDLTPAAYPSQEWTTEQAALDVTR